MLPVQVIAMKNILLLQCKLYNIEVLSTKILRRDFVAQNVGHIIRLKKYFIS